MDRTRSERPPRRAAARRMALAVAGATAALLGASCAPPPGPPAPPGPPVISSFVARAERSQAPVLATLGWSISDPNNDVLRCRVDIDGDGTFDKEILPCSSRDSVLGDYDTPGSRAPVLEVSDPSFPAVTSTTTFEVAPGPSEDYEITLRLNPATRPEFVQAFEDAAARWEQVLAAGVPDVQLNLPPGLFGLPAFNGVVDDVLIDASAAPIDGPGKILGSAGGILVRTPRWQPYYGIMQFDEADLDGLLASGRLDDVILHEMGHVLGLGPSWLITGMLTDVLTDPSYIGRAGIAAYQELGGVRNVPVENSGGQGTVFGHWRESVFGDELMTGYLGSAPTTLSRLSIAALADLGYGVDFSTAEPYSLPTPSAAARSAEPPMELEVLQIPPFLDGLPDDLPDRLPTAG